MNNVAKRSIISVSVVALSLGLYGFLGGGRSDPSSSSSSGDILSLLETPAPAPASAPLPRRPEGVFAPEQVRGVDVWVDGELLFWQASSTALFYGTTSSSHDDVIDGRAKIPHIDWKTGCRVGLGYQLPHDRWDLYAGYTYLPAEARGHAGGAGRVVFPAWGTHFVDADVPFYADTASAQWNLHLNMADLELGRTCAVSPWLSMRPFVCVRGLWVDQTYRIQYNGGSAGGVGADKIHLSSDCWAVGLRVGVNGLWGLGKGFSLYSDGSASLLSGSFKVHETGTVPKEIDEERGDTVDSYNFALRSSPHQVVGDADLALGVQWDYLFSQDRYHVGVKLGWEFDYFFEQNQLFHFLGGRPPFGISRSGDTLSFQGLTLGFRFDF